MSWLKDLFGGKKDYDAMHQENINKAQEDSQRSLNSMVNRDQVPTNPNQLFPWMARQGQSMQKEAEAIREDYKVPEEVLKAYQFSQSLLGGKSALQSGMEENASRSLAGNLSNINKGATSATQAILAGSGAQQAYGGQMNQATMAGAQQQNQRQGMAQNMALNMGDFRTTEYDFNHNLPYLQKLQFAQDYLGTGVQGMMDLYGIGEQKEMAKKDRRARMIGGLIQANSKAAATVATGGAG